MMLDIAQALWTYALQRADTELEAEPTRDWIWPARRRPYDWARQGV